MPAPILKEYMKGIQESVAGINHHKDRVRGRCAVANATYLLGDLAEGNKLAKKNWEYARGHESDTDAELKWMASYAHFNSTLFLGEFEKAMELMADHWLVHYAKLDPVEQEKVLNRCHIL
jgi:hypothetical protein